MTKGNKHIAIMRDDFLYKENYNLRQENKRLYEIASDKNLNKKNLLLIGFISGIGFMILVYCAISILNLN